MISCTFFGSTRARSSFRTPHSVNYRHVTDALFTPCCRTLSQRCDTSLEQTLLAGSLALQPHIGIHWWCMTACLASENSIDETWGGKPRRLACPLFQALPAGTYHSRDHEEVIGLIILPQLSARTVHTSHGVWMFGVSDFRRIDIPLNTTRPR